jgi:hypothetical protein
VIALTLVAELVELDDEAAFLAYVRRNHPALFPRLPERSRYNRRRRQLTEVTNRIRGALMRLVLGRLAREECELCVLDRLPVPVVGFAHARGEHRWCGEASYGDVASKRQTIFGDKLQLLSTHSGLIRAFALAPAHHAAGALAEQLLLDKHRLTVRGDKAYLHAALQALLAWRNDLALLTPGGSTSASGGPPRSPGRSATSAHSAATEPTSGPATAYPSPPRASGRCSLLSSAPSAHAASFTSA